MVVWRANKQATVTTSLTETELLALAQAAKEGLFASRLITALRVNLPTHGSPSYAVDHPHDPPQVVIQWCSTQTFRLVKEEII